MKRHKGIPNAYCFSERRQSEEAICYMILTYDILERATLWRHGKYNWFPGVGRRDE